MSPFGRPLEEFLFDPPLPLPEGLDLVNKPRLWLRVDPVSGEPVLDPQTAHPIYDLLIHVGAEHYPYAPDYIEETRRLGASRRLNAHLNLAKLSRRSRMLLAHPKAIPADWKELMPPAQCKKRLAYHDQAFYESLYRDLLGLEESLDATHDDERVGPCIFKLWEALPKEEAVELFEDEGDPPLCLRRVGSTLYAYHPTGEEVSAWQEGFILALPITCIALIQRADGSVHEQAREKLLAGRQQHGNMALPFYETDK